MKMKIPVILFFLLLAAGNSLKAQRNLTGVWEGIMGDELLQINLQQKGDSLCGFTYDFELRKPADHCRAKFTGYYSSSASAWYLTGRYFIENSGTHDLMQIKLIKLADDGKDTITALVERRSIFSFKNLNDTDPEDGYKLRKVSYKPDFTGFIEPCFPVPPKKNKITTPPKPVAPAPLKPKPVPPKKPVPPPVLLKKDTATRTPAEIKKPQAKAPADILKQLNTRKNTEQSRLIIDDDHINLKLYDNGTVDDDSVSVFYNGRLLVNNKRLSEKPIEINIDLDTTVIYHEITLFANNLGSIPPNTALIIATAGGKRYELRSKASLEENAVLIFEYRKKEK
jgi:hypothetical protein